MPTMRKMKLKTGLFLSLALLLQLVLPLTGGGPTLAGGGYRTASAATAGPDGGALDLIVFGDPASEAAHDFQGARSRIVSGFRGEPARVAEPAVPVAKTGGDLTFTMRVDPDQRNYFTVKLAGGDSNNGTTSMVNLNGEQIGYLRHGDYESLKSYGPPDQFYYFTVMLPLESTRGKETAELTISTANLWEDMTADSKPFYRAYTHTAAYLDVADEVQGSAPGEGRAAADLKREGLTPQERQARVDAYMDGLASRFADYSSKVDGGPGAKLSIIRYQDELKSYASMLKTDWSPADTPAQKRAGLERIFKTIDNHVKDYYGNVLLVLRGGHQGDWGGYYGALGEALYLVEPLIRDDAIYGETAFEALLDEPFDTGTSAGEFSLASADWEGGELTRREAWERALKANFDFARARLSYIYNQMLYTYEGAWEAQEGLRIIASDFYEGRARSERILLESLGIEPFLGEEVLLGPAGEELDLYHSLFYHDGNARFTTDFEQYVAKGLAQSKLDEHGEVVRRLPYGEHYTGLTADGLTRENSYVANYGEAANYLLNYFYKTHDHDRTEADRLLNDRILQAALRNLHARGQTRYPGLDDAGNRVMKAEQATDDRNQSFPGFDAYGARIGTGMTIQFASLEMAMEQDEARYAGEAWEPYWQYAREAVGYAQQQLLDNQLIERDDFGNSGTNSALDYRLQDTYAYVTGGRAGTARFAGEAMAGVVLPHTELDWYTEQELAELNVDPADYTQRGWADIDNMYLSIRDGDTRLFGNFMYRLKGQAGSGRIRATRGAYSQIVQIATNNLFRYEDVYLRPANPDVDYMGAQTDNPSGAPFAHVGEVLPIAYQPGVGTVSRDGLATDTPYAGYSELQTSRYGPYFTIFNTTREAYGNERTYEVELPDDYDGDDVLDLVSGSRIPVREGKVTIAPMTAMALKLATDATARPQPLHVDYASALVGDGVVQVVWKTTAGGESYTIKRARSEGGPYTVIAEGVRGNAYEDRTAEPGQTYHYQVAAVGTHGEGWASWPAAADLSGRQTAAAGWLDTAVGAVGGTATAVAEPSGLLLEIAGAGGDGFADGDDNVLYARDMRDELRYVHVPSIGNSETTVRLDVYGGEASGILLREGLDEASRYAYFGTDESGALVLRTRTRNSMHQWSDETVSPLEIPITAYAPDAYPYLKLVRHHASQYVYAMVSADGVQWSYAAKALALLPYGYYSGLAASDDAAFGEARVEHLPDDALLPYVERQADQVTLHWSKPKQAVRFHVYRTTDAAAGLQAPVLGAGSLEPAPGSSWTRVLADAERSLSYTDKLRYGDAYYAILAEKDDGTLLPMATIGASAESLEALLEQAYRYDRRDYTRLSYDRYMRELARIEAGLGEPDARLRELIDALYEARELLVPVGEVYLQGGFGGTPEDALYEPIAITPEMVVASDRIWSSSGGTGTPQQNGWFAFDGDVATGTDTQSSRGWVRADLGADGAVRIEAVRYHPRPCCTTRLNGGMIQGSADGSVWDDLYTIGGVAANVSQWYAAPLATERAYRYYRYFDNHGGNTNIGELELYRRTFDSTLLRELLEEAARAIDAAVYTEASYAALDAAVGEARAATDQESADRESAELAAALDALELIPGMPVLRELADRTILAEQALELRLEASNASGAVAYGVSGLPSGATFDIVDDTGRFVWTPTLTQGGVYAVTFTAESQGLRSSKTIELTVVGAPVVAPDQTAELTASQAYRYELEAAEPSGLELAIAVSGLPEGAAFDATTRTLSWTPRQSDYGRHTVVFEVSNGRFAQTHSLTLEVRLRVLAQQGYTRASYYRYTEEVARIEAAMGAPDADKSLLAAELAQAEAELIDIAAIYDDPIAVTPDMVRASSRSWDGQYDEAANGWHAFDGKLTTSPDTTSSGGWTRVDFGAGNAQTIEVVKYYPRPGQNHARMNGAVLEGSQDGVTFALIHTFAGVTDGRWAAVATGSEEEYRYVRYRGGYANVAELQFHLQTADRTLLAQFVEEAAAIDDVRYTRESRERLGSELAYARAVQGSGASQADVDAAAERLRAAIDGLQPQGLRVSGPAEAAAGEQVELTASLIHVTDSVYSGAFTLIYAPHELSYLGAAAAGADATVQETVYEDGRVTIVQTATGGLGGAPERLDLVKLRFAAASDLTHDVTSKVYVSDMETASETGVADLVYSLGDYEVVIRAAAPEPDRSVLEARIAAAAERIESAVVDETLWGHHSAAAVQALEQALAAARAVATDPQASQPDLDAAAAQLLEATTRFAQAAGSTASVADLSEIARHYGLAADDAKWPTVRMYDLDADGRLGLADLAGLARMIPGQPQAGTGGASDSDGQTDGFELHTATPRVQVGDTLTVRLSARALRDLYGYELRLRYDAERLEWTGGTDEQAGFGWEPLRDGDAVMLLHTMQGEQTGLRGDHELYTLTFRAKAAGEASIVLTGAAMADSSAEPGLRAGRIGSPLVLDVRPDDPGSGGPEEPEEPHEPEEPNEPKTPEEPGGPDRPDPGDDDAAPGEGIITPRDGGVEVILAAQPDESGVVTARMSAEQLRAALAAAGEGSIHVRIAGDATAVAYRVTIPLAPLRAAAASAQLFTVEAGASKLLLHAPLLRRLTQSDGEQLELLLEQMSSPGQESAERSGGAPYAVGAGTALPGDRPPAREQAMQASRYAIRLSVDGEVWRELARGEAAAAIPYALAVGEAPHQVVVYRSDEPEAAGEPGPEAIVYSRYAEGRAVFPLRRSGTFSAVYRPVQFADIAAGHWARTAIETLAARSVALGVGAERFEPGGEVSRAEFVALLMRALGIAGGLSGAGEGSPAAAFADLMPDAWYTDTIVQAREFGIVSGRPDGSFGPDEAISRQEMAVLIGRTLQLLDDLLSPEAGAGTHTSGDAGSVFADAAEIAPYAREAVARLQRAGLLEGVGGGRFAPHTQTTRAQAAVLIDRFLAALSGIQLQ
ncbi:S-layer homology domain-containing protein [Paenibacillus sp. IB182496]|uniref:S-layer homology domain-containing protein n=1 Tax=Paenibacillus sabuli TaxID=2772509 RepID=A0A927GU94_9BACL|nr:S-layer homology domain-containing protein [Paenibacillus sabuli]MBD2848116.1 S-layer homology domain-containing protein [Paenibacillus sabuli]